MFSDEEILKLISRFNLDERAKWTDLTENEQDALIRACYGYNAESKEGACRACGSRSLEHIEDSAHCRLIKNAGGTISIGKGRVAALFIDTDLVIIPPFEGGRDAFIKHCESHFV